MPKTINVYTHKLSFWVMLCVLFNKVFHFKNIHVYVVNDIASSFNASFIRVIVRTCATIELIEDGLGDFTGPEGQHLQIIREQLLYDVFQSRAEQIDFSRLSKAVGCYYESDELRRFTARIIVHYYWEPLASQLLLWAFSERHDGKKLLIASMPTEGKEWRVFFESRFQIISEIKCSWHLELLLWTLKLLKQYVRAITTRPKDIKIPSVKKIAVQMLMGPQPNRRAGDLDWMSGSELEGKDIVYYLDGNIRKGADWDDALRWCQERGVELVDLVGWTPSAKSHNFGTRIFKIITSLFLLPFRRVSSSGSTGFSAVVVCIFAVYAERWRAFLLGKNICGCIGMSDTNLSALPQVWAIESVGGVDLSFEFSATGHHSFMDARPLGRHQYAVWGKLSHDMVKQCEGEAGLRLGPEYYFLMGNMRHYLQHREIPELELLRVRMRNHQGSVVGIFDAVWTRLKILSRHQCIEFLGAVLDLAESMPDALFIFKPQQKMVFNSTQSQRLEQLVNENRLIIIESEILPHQIYNELDLAVGSAIYSSALIEALSALVPVIYFDNNPWQHIMRERLDASLLAGNVEELLEKVTAILELKKELRLPMPLVKDLDRYNDDLGNDRWGWLLELWLKEIRKHGSADNAVEEVVSQYRARYGSDSVLRA